MDNITFRKMVNEDIAWYKEKGMKPDYYKILRNNSLMIFKWEYLFVVINNIICECATITSARVIGFLIGYIKAPKGTVEESDGYKLVALFVGLMLVTSFARCRYMHNGFIVGFRLRRVLVTSIYDKVAKLSVKSVSSVNPGKLISLVSSDLYQVEKGLALSPVLIAAPVVNLYAFILIYTIGGW